MKINENENLPVLPVTT